MMFSSSVSISASLRPCSSRRVAVADLDRPHLREVDDLDRLDRERQVPARAGLRGLGVLAEARHDAAAAFVDDVEAAREPDDQRPARRAAPRRRAASSRRRRPPPPSSPSPPRLRPNRSFRRRLTLRQISSRSGGPPPLLPRLPHWGSLSDIEVREERVASSEDGGGAPARSSPRSGVRADRRRIGRAAAVRRGRGVRGRGNRSASAGLQIGARRRRSARSRERP